MNCTTFQVSCQQDPAGHHALRVYYNALGVQSIQSPCNLRQAEAVYRLGGLSCYFAVHRIRLLLRGIKSPTSLLPLSLEMSEWDDLVGRIETRRLARARAAPYPLLPSPTRLRYLAFIDRVAARAFHFRSTLPTNLPCRVTVRLYPAGFHGRECIGLEVAAFHFASRTAAGTWLVNEQAYAVLPKRLQCPDCSMYEGEEFQREHLASAAHHASVLGALQRGLVLVMNLKLAVQRLGKDVLPLPDF